MERTVVGLIALLIVGVFLASLIIAIKSIPLAIITLGVFAVAAYDFWEDVKRRRNSNNGASVR